ncbi:MAG: hypothetical protein HY234_07740 [Acidobacteria bacterium]|nr:hypothetical protein [Acidobacteriota bacterium]
MIQVARIVKASGGDESAIVRIFTRRRNEREQLRQERRAAKLREIHIEKGSGIEWSKQEQFRDGSGGRRNPTLAEIENQECTDS